MNNAVNGNHSNKNSPTEEEGLGKWKVVEVLGTGKYGKVSLWKHEETGHRLAMKECSKELDEKMMVHWRREVEIIQTLHHEGLVKVDKQAQIGKCGSENSEIRRLPLEYCNGGDLRKILRKSEHCCGLEEYWVRELLRQLSSAIEYLHNNKIMHRDIKPENIILHHDHKTKNVCYKLTDFGYAVRWELEPCAREFVGTAQYLAPEMLSNKEYSHTIDYWCFGTVVFECITGHRPFVPTLAIPQWFEVVNKKQSDHICAVKLTTGIYMKINMDRWLMWMLLLDPNLRGGPLQDDNRIHCFSALEEILDTKIIHIYSIHGNKHTAIPVLDEDDDLCKLQQEIGTNCGIVVDSQLLLLPNGDTADLNTVIEGYWMDMSPDKSLVFVFNSNHAQSEDSEALVSDWIDGIMPSIVKAIKDEDTHVPYMQLKYIYRSAVYFCQKLNFHYERVTQGYGAIINHLTKLKSDLSQKKLTLLATYHKYLGKLEVFKDSLEQDLQSYQEQSASGIESEKIYNSWLKSRKEFDRIEKVGQNTNISEFIHSTDVLQDRLLKEIDTHQVDACHKQIQHLKTEALKLLHGLLQIPKDQRDKVFSCSKMSSVINRSMKAWKKYYKYMDASISVVLKLVRKVSYLDAELELVLQQFEKGGQDLMRLHQKRQNDVWTLLKLQSQVVAAVTNLNHNSNNDTKLSIVRV
uniref:IkappaB kinase n=1 Tax=Saccoglossus kowalevskii TaxID=10224 RepID=A0ABM0MNW4_SACKO|nr:PREDICTED: inhibitor of nuclear factor kappa-B kinase subunit alpha-like [Saccoglossus kowalevskii]